MFTRHSISLRSLAIVLIMTRGLRRFQQAHCLHFITFSCSRRAPLLATPQSRRVFEQTLERVRKWYGLYITGYVVMPEHVHLLLSEPERGKLSVAIQMLKQNVASQLTNRTKDTAFWQARYYDFNVWTEAKQIEKLRYMHRNPVKRGLAAKPEDWEWGSFRHHASGFEGVVEIESHWTARRREALGLTLRVVSRDEDTHPVSPKCGETSVGHPKKKP
jgi:putative transposase